MLTENKKFIIIYILLVVITILNVLELKSSETNLKASLLEPQRGGYDLVADNPSLRRPGGYHYGRVQMLTLAGQRRINIENPNLDVEKCKEAYLTYYSRQSEEEAKNALLTMHNCER